MTQTQNSFSKRYGILELDYCHNEETSKTFWTHHKNVIVSGLKKYHLTSTVKKKHQGLREKVPELRDLVTPGNDNKRPH